MRRWPAGPGLSPARPPRRGPALAPRPALCPGPARGLFCTRSCWAASPPKPSGRPFFLITMAITIVLSSFGLLLSRFASLAKPTLTLTFKRRVRHRGPSCCSFSVRRASSSVPVGCITWGSRRLLGCLIRPEQLPLPSAR